MSFSVNFNVTITITMSITITISITKTKNLAVSSKQKLAGSKSWWKQVLKKYKISS